MNGTGIRNTILSSALALGLAAFAGCARVDTGPLVTQTRDVPPFTSIELRGAARLDVLVGEAQSVVVEADEDSLQALSTTVHGKQLVIDTRDRGFWMREGERHVRITVPTLERVALNGAASGSVHGLSGGSAALILSGAGEFEASGTVERLVANVNGAGNMDLAHLVAGDAKVVVNGTGNIQVQASERLDATVNGVGNIEYVGRPRDLNTAIHGVGSIEQSDRGGARN